jgi:ATP-dependent DNA helicase RecG
VSRDEGGLGRLVEAVRTPLVFAAQGGFAALATMPRLGAELRAACDALIKAALPPERVGPVVAWRRALERFEKLPRHEQEVAIAKGLRLCQALGGPAPARPSGAASEQRGHRGEGPGRPPASGSNPGSPSSPSSPLSSLPSPAPPPSSPLDLPLTTLSGIGPALAAHFAEAGLETLEDLIWLVPRRYDDLRQVVHLGAALATPEGERVTFVARVRSSSFSRFGRRFLQVALVGADDPTAVVTARWFGVQGGMARRFEKGRLVVLSGAIRRREVKGARQAELNNPEVIGDADEQAPLARGGGIRPRYAPIDGVAPAIVRKAGKAAAAQIGDALVDGVPAAVAERLGLPSLGAALAALHDPAADLSPEAFATLAAGKSAEHRRLAFDELFFLGLAVARRRAERQGERASPCAAPGVLAEAEALLPFALTGAQRRAAGEILADLGGERPMGRLLQGDVGAGKTAVAFVAALAAKRAGRQFALMAPTEILAEQHGRTLDAWCRAAGARVAVLTAQTPRGSRESILGLLAQGALDGVIGTHALLAERVEFADLGVAVIDEQHRFGVAQRARLRQKGALPHLLVMTATPIPRTLALTAYGDLDVSVLDELPPGRTPTDTRICAGAPGRRRAYDLLEKGLAKGARAFVVCPLVEKSDEPDGPTWQNAVDTAARLEGALGPYRVGLVHGRMAQDERERQILALRDGGLDVLVATTVIEVGVDVPAARIIVIEDADRFGLAQLHQLRGRVGRGGGGSLCLLVTKGAGTSEAAARLSIMAATNDGFRIAEADLEIRGPGEVFGRRQAGLPKLRFGDLTAHAELLRLARVEADALCAADPELAAPEHVLTKQVLEQRTKGPVYGAESG